MAVSAAAWPTAATRAGASRTAAAAAGAYSAVPLELRLDGTLESVRFVNTAHVRVLRAASCSRVGDLSTGCPANTAAKSVLFALDRGAIHGVSSTAAAVVEAGAVLQRRFHGTLDCCRVPSCYNSAHARRPNPQAVAAGVAAVPPPAAQRPCGSQGGCCRTKAHGSCTPDIFSTATVAAGHLSCF